MLGSVTSLTQTFSDAFKMWAERANCSYVDYSSNNDNDGYVNNIDVFKEQGYDGFIFDPDVTLYQRVAEVAGELDINWMPGMGTFYDTDGKLAHPCVGFDNKQFGADMANWLIDYAKNNFKGFSPDAAGFISLDFSSVPQIHDRSTGEQEAWNSAFPGREKDFYIGDGVTTGQMTSDTGFNLTAGIMSSHPEIKFWLIGGCADDFSNGAERAVESMDKQDTTVVSTIGGTALISEWDTGDDPCWKSAVYTANALFTEPIFFGLYAMMNKDATPESLWPEWVNKSNGEKYAAFLLPSQILTKDNYQEYLEFIDQYTGSDFYHYSYKGTIFETRMTPPASNAG